MNSLLMNSLSMNSTNGLGNSTNGLGLANAHGNVAVQGTDTQGWREPPALTLNASGVIINCSERGEEFFGYSRTELACRHVSEVLPQLSEWELLQDGEPNAHFSFLCHIGHAFRVQPRDGRAFHSALSLVCLRDAGETILRLIALSPHEAAPEGSPAAA